MFYHWALPMATPVRTLLFPWHKPLTLTDNYADYELQTKIILSSTTATASQTQRDILDIATAVGD